MYDKGNATYTSHDNYTHECKCKQDSKGWHMDCKVDAGLQQHVRSFNTRMNGYVDVTQQILDRSLLALNQKQSTQSLYTFSQYSKDLAFVPIQGTWPTVGGLYEADAKRICQEEINKYDALQRCQLEAKVNFAGIIDMCVEDIKITGDVAMVSTAVHTAMSMCVEVVVKNPTVFVPGDPATLNLLLNRPCIGNCSGNGICTQGKCNCKSGFDGNDCSVDITKQPVIQQIVSGDKCDIQLGPCQKIYMSVSNFYHTTESRCHLLEKTFSNGHFVETGYGFHTTAEQLTSKDISCLLPSQSDVQGKSIVAYTVSVTSDGEKYSPSKTIVIYDSACMTCDANSNCAIKPQTCMIDGNCRVANIVKPDDQTYRCVPQVNNTAWTNEGLIITRADIWTRKQYGCVCNFNTIEMDCACCEEGAVQCPYGSHHQCVQSGSLSSCGTLMPAPLYGIDGYTRSLTGCVCDHNKSLLDCACCQNGGVQCGSHFRNQCVQFGHLDQCGQKQYVFGP
ncbi:hypothetical protein ACJMK2_018160 [Sinanodonta woodiana]|uniref:EGF-like domain-containing protein n=1 Tax=Sinanodonta woodiana TaxID=1069815 RepID=A0ABD3UF85_SINWO